MKYYLPFITCFFFFQAYGQPWEIYSSVSYQGYYNKSIIQSYDGGYVIALGKATGSHFGYPRIDKISRDGKLLWSKRLICDNLTVNDLCEATDGSIIIVGGSTCIDTNRAAYILKLNSCGEREWIKSSVFSASMIG